MDRLRKGIAIGMLFGTANSERIRELEELLAEMQACQEQVAALLGITGEYDCDDIKEAIQALKDALAEMQQCQQQVATLLELTGDIDCDDIKDAITEMKNALAELQQCQQEVMSMLGLGEGADCDDIKDKIQAYKEVAKKLYDETKEKIDDNPDIDPDELPDEPEDPEDPDPEELLDYVGGAEIADTPSVDNTTPPPVEPAGEDDDDWTEEVEGPSMHYSIKADDYISEISYKYAGWGCNSIHDMRGLDVFYTMYVTESVYTISDHRFITTNTSGHFINVFANYIDLIPDSEIWKNWDANTWRNWGLAKGKSWWANWVSPRVKFTYQNPATGANEEDYLGLPNLVKTAYNSAWTNKKVTIFTGWYSWHDGIHRTYWTTRN